MVFSLEPWAEKFIPDVAKYANNPKIACFLRDVFPHPYTQTDADWFIHDCMAKNEAESLFRAIVVDDHAVGSLSVMKGSDVYQKSGELGYWLAEEYWGKGIMTQAVKEICSLAFPALDIVRIYAEPYANNPASRRVLEKAGFTLEGIKKKSVYKGGTLYDSCLYARVL